MVALPVSAVLANYTQVPTIRKRYRLACPIHRSDNPSTFSVVDDELWYCFVCQRGGTSVELLSILEGIPRWQAVERMGVEKGSWLIRQSAWDLKGKVDGMRQKELPEVQPPDDLGQPFYPLRELAWPTVKHWGLRSYQGGTYFPFRDVDGRLVGWSIRQDQRVPRYLNSPGFRRNRFLYGLYENKACIQRRGEVILVEGQFDALAVWDAGFPNVCCTLGCHLSKDQVRLLLPWVDRLKVLYDGDTAGRNAAVELKCKWQSVFGIELLYLPDGQDPSSVGSNELQRLLE